MLQAFQIVAQYTFIIKLWAGIFNALYALVESII